MLACAGFGETDPSRNGIYTIRSSDGGGLTRVTSNPAGDDEVGDYSPDGKHLVFVRNNRDGNVGLFVVRLNGTGLRRITPPGMMLNPEEGGSWSPRSSEILFSARSAPGRRLSVWVVNSDGSELREIPITPSCGGAFSDPKSVGCSEARWSPDGSKIVFVRNSKATQKDIYTVNLDGIGLTQVTHAGFDEFPDWGPHAPA
jgi:Tol biopolymer transport system component